MTESRDGTQVYTDHNSGALKVRRWVVRVVSGKADKAQATIERGSMHIGSASSNDIRVDDPRVSRAHLELRLLEDGLWVRDLESSNGTYQGNARIRETLLEGASLLRLGDTELAIEPIDEELKLNEDDSCLGEMVGTTTAMRRLFAIVKRIAPTDVTVLVEGETGTGKELVARELHSRSPRSSGPMVVVDCGALPSGLVESELFGHVRGAFTGAMTERDGAFAQANGGTLFLDEVGELPLDLQPKLLRVLESRQVKRVGGDRLQPIDVRVVAATSRDLSERAKQQLLRPDLFYRLAVVRLKVPPLRERLEDLPVLVRSIAARIAGREIIVPEGVIAQLAVNRWPGNVRELRNVIDQSLAMRPDSTILQLDDQLDDGPPLNATGDAGGDYREAKAQAIAAFEIRYLTGLLDRHAWNVSSAAREAGVDRNYLHRLIRRYDLQRPARSS
jgi:transcriptional regulator with GAF, ATPase, and Fis domain